MRYMEIVLKNGSYVVEICGNSSKSCSENASLRTALDDAVDEFQGFRSEKHIVVPYISEKKLTEIESELLLRGAWAVGL